MSPSRYLLPLFVLVVAGTVGWMAFGSTSEEAQPNVDLAENTGPIQLAELEVSTVEPGTLTRSIRISGSIQPVRRTTLNAQVSGTLSEVTVQVGDHVVEGAVLVRFDTVALQSTLDARVATLDARKAQLQLAQATLNRSRQLGTQGIASEANLLSAEADVLNLQAQVRALEAEVNDARKALEDAVVRAPFDGVVATREVEPGQTLALNASLMTLVDLKRVEVDAGVPTSRVASVQVGQSATISVEGFPDRTFEAKVTRISPVAVEGSRAVRVFLSLDNADGALRGGMFATGEIAVEERPNVIALPNSAVRKDDTGNFVLKAENGRLTRQGVETGATWADRGLVEIAFGLRAGDVVVTAPLPGLEPDTEVTIADAG